LHEFRLTPPCRLELARHNAMIRQLTGASEQRLLHGAGDLSQLDGQAIEQVIRVHLAEGS